MSLTATTRSGEGSRQKRGPIVWSAILCALLVPVLLAGCVRDACNGECGPDQVCDETYLACVPVNPDGGDRPGSCNQDADCASADKPRCDMGSGRCVACAEDGHCAEGRRCDSLTQVCVERGCIRESDCAGVPGKPFCSSSGVCVGCMNDSNCPPVAGIRRVCNVTDRVCVDSPCKSDQQCATDPGGRLCQTDTGRCVQCRGDDDCTSGAIPHCRPETNICVQCLEDAHCDAANGEVCNLATLRCRLTGCQVDAQCDGPSYCQVDTRECVPCLDDEHCALGGACGPLGFCRDVEACEDDGDCVWPRSCATGACVECEDDGDCSGGRVCDAGSCVEPETCVTSASCDANRVCNDGACIDSGCIPDAFSPNGSPARAAALSNGVVDARLCPNENDWFALDFEEGHGAEVVVRSDAAHGSPKLELYWGDGRPEVVATGVVRAAGELRAVVESTGSGSGSLLARVWSNGETSIPYRLETRVIPGGFCDDDAREPDDVLADATTLTPGQYAGTLCPADLDWIAVSVPHDSRLVVKLALADADPELAEIRVFTMDGTTPHQIAHGVDVVRVEPNVSGVAKTHWISLAHLDEDGAKFEYVVELEIAPRPPANDLCEDARTLVPGDWRNGTTVGAEPNGTASCAGANGGRDVFWKLSLDEPSSLDLQLDASFHGALTLETACDGVELACAASETSSSRRLTFDGLPAGDYVVRVTTSGDQSGTYSLRAVLGEAPAIPGAASCEDEAVPLDFSAEGVAEVSGNLSLASDAIASTCGADGHDAIYAITLTEPQRLRAALTAFPGASISLFPADDCGEVASKCSAVTEGAVQTSFDLPHVEAGEWRLVVDGGSHRSGAFSLAVELADSIPPPANDVCEDAIDLIAEVSGDTRAASDDFTPPASCAAPTHAGGDAVYRLVVEEEEDIVLELEAGFDASLTVTDSPCDIGAVLACGDGNAARLHLPALSPGEYFVWVDAYDAASGPFTLTLERLPPTPLPSNDVCEAAEVVDVASGPVVIDASTSRAVNDLEPVECRPGSPSDPSRPPLALVGRDVAYAVEVPAGAELVASLTATFDAALYLLDVCEDDSCLAGSDAFFLADEEVRWSNDGDEPRTVRVIVDAWRDGEHGPFSLGLEVRNP